MRWLLVTLLLFATTASSCDRIFGATYYWRATCHFTDGTKWTGREVFDGPGDATDNACVEGPDECVTYGADEYVHINHFTPGGDCEGCDQE